MKRLAILLVSLFLICRPAGAQTAPAKPERPIPAIERVLILSVDGLRPDLLALAQAPNIVGLAKGGAYSFWARTTAVATTLPSHTSMLTGVQPRKHRIEWNSDLPLSQPVYPAYPTVLELARQAGYSAALVAGKSKFSFLTKGLDQFRVPEKDDPDDQAAGSEALRIFKELQPELFFVHFPAVDRTGHQLGWGSPEQLEAVAAADRQIGVLLKALDESGLRAKTAIILSADHGGRGMTHGPDDPPSRHIPWIIHGPKVRAGYDLTRTPGLEIRTEDTCATAAWLLGLEANPKWDGKPVQAAFELAE